MITLFFFNEVAHVETNNFSFQLAFWNIQTILPRVFYFQVPPLLKDLKYVTFLFMNFCDKPPTWIRICHTSNRCSFGHHVNMSLILCISNCVVFHTYISFVFCSFPFSVPYPPWLATSYSCTFFTLLVWTYHWWFGYPLVLVLM